MNAFPHRSWAYLQTPSVPLLEDDLDDSARRLQHWQSKKHIRLGSSRALIVAWEPSLTERWMPPEQNGAYLLYAREAATKGQSSESEFVVGRDPFIDLLISLGGGAWEIFALMIFEAAPGGRRRRIEADRSIERALGSAR